MKKTALRTAQLRSCALLLMIMVGAFPISAQNFMNVRKVDGAVIRFPVNEIDSVWFDVEEPGGHVEEPSFNLSGGYIYYKDGKKYNSTSWKCSDFILIDPNRNYYLNIPLPGYNGGYAFYDANKNYISGANTISDNMIASPMGACYLRFSVPPQMNEEYIVFYILKEKFLFSWNNGYIHYGNGLYYNSASWICSDYISIEANSDYYLNIPLPGYNGGLAFYDENMNYISGQNTITADMINSPAGACYLRISSQNKYMDKIILSTLDKLSDNKERPIELGNGYIHYGNGVYYNSASWKCSNFIPVEANKGYHLNAHLPGYNAGYAFYDSNKNFIKGANTITNDTITCPSGACFLRFSTQNKYSESILFYVLEGNGLFCANTNGDITDDSDTNGTNQTGNNLTIRNNNQNQRNILPSGATLLDSGGAIIGLDTNYGKDNQVLSIPVRYTADNTMVIRFKVKFNDDLNKRSSQINYNEENPSLLNFFTMSSGSHKVRLGVLPDVFKNPDLKRNYESYGQGVGLQGTTKIRAVSANNSYGTDMAKVTALTFDNYRFKTLTGGKLMSVRWLDNTAANADVCLSNNGNTLRFYHSTSNSVICEYNLSIYSTLSDLYNAMQSNSQIEVRLLQDTNKTPSDLIEFSGIKLVSERNVVDGPGYSGNTYPTKIVYDNAPLYILDKIDTDWHTVEIAADRSLNSGVFCCCIDGTYLYAGSNPERISYFDGDTIKYYFGGDENGTKINCSIKDIEIKYDNLEETEIVSYNSSSRPQIISDWHPKVYVLEGHNFSDTYEGGQSVDRMNQIFQGLTEKGYVPITLAELQDWVVDGVAAHKRMYYAIYDDHQYEIYLNPTLRNLHDTYNVKLGLAEITNQTWWDYDGTRYTVCDLNDSMTDRGWVPLTHTRHQVHNMLGYDDLVQAIQTDLDDLALYHIPQIGLVWPGGQTNIMCQELVKEKGWIMAFDIYRTGYYASITDAVKRCDKHMMLPRFVISNRIPLGSVLQEIQ